MKITMKHHETIVVIDETDNPKTNEKRSTIRWQGQQKLVLEVLNAMAEAIVRIENPGVAEFAKP